MIEICLEVMLTILIDLVTQEWNSEIPATIFSACFSLTLGSLFILFPGFILIFYLLRIKDWEDKNFHQRWGAILETQRFNYSTRNEGSKWIAIIHPFSVVLRRIIFSLVVVLAPDFTWLHLSTIIFTQKAIWMFLAYYKPFLGEF